MGHSGHQPHTRHLEYLEDKQNGVQSVPEMSVLCNCNKGIKTGDRKGTFIGSIFYNKYGIICKYTDWFKVVNRCLWLLFIVMVTSMSYVSELVVRT